MWQMEQNSAFSGQFILIGTVVSEGYNPKVAKGSTCAMISIVDCDELYRKGTLDNYIIDDGFDAGAILDDTLGQFGWVNIKVKSALPIAQKEDGWEPEIAALIKTARTLGVAHMVFEPEAEAPELVH